jgi:HK97 gp10 family phage protein
MARSRQLKNFEKRLAAIPARAREAVRPALEKSAEELAGMMRVLVPIDEGELKDSIVVQNTEVDTQILVTAGNDDAPHARWVEFGTPEAREQAFFYPSVRLLQKRIQRRIKSAIGRAIRKEFHK